MTICSDHLLILWHDVMLLPSVCLLNANLKGNCLLLFVGNVTHTTATIHYNAITTHTLSWWYETENKNNHYHNQCANYLPLSKNLWIIYCIILKFRKLSNTTSLVVLEWNISKDFGRAYAPLQRKWNHKIMNYSQYVSVSMWWHIFMPTQHTKPQIIRVITFKKSGNYSSILI
jgi:hypothetical protein